MRTTMPAEDPTSKDFIRTTLADRRVRFDRWTRLDHWLGLALWVGLLGVLLWVGQA